MTGKTRGWLRVVLVSLVVAVLTACLFLPDFLGQIDGGKYDPAADGAPRPMGTAGIPDAEEQTEPHTCGLHAMRSMYKAYRLDAERYDLRFRLGTDHPAMRVDKDSTGTLHPDLYRVLAQDGFFARPIALEHADAAAELRDHLDRQHLALAVVYRSTYHWVLVGPGDGAGQLAVYDSLQHDAPLAGTAGALLDEALSITLVEPAEPGQFISTTDAHAEGLAEMTRLVQRKK